MNLISYNPVVDLGSAQPYVVSPRHMLFTVSNKNEAISKLNSAYSKFSTATLIFTDIDEDGISYEIHEIRKNKIKIMDKYDDSITLSEFKSNSVLSIEIFDDVFEPNIENIMIAKYLVQNLKI